VAASEEPASKSLYRKLAFFAVKPQELYIPLGEFLQAGIDPPDHVLGFFNYPHCVSQMARPAVAPRCATPAKWLKPARLRGKSYFCDNTFPGSVYLPILSLNQPNFLQ
jgi:hypothetical protein